MIYYLPTIKSHGIGKRGRHLERRPKSGMEVEEKETE
jgi:hypothetical protein